MILPSRLLLKYFSALYYSNCVPWCRQWLTAVCCVIWLANACLHIIENNEKRWKIMKKAWATSFLESLPIADQHELYVSLLCSWWKKYFFHDFPMVFFVFDHTNACASMPLLVKIHKSCLWNKSQTEWSKFIHSTLYANYMDCKSMVKQIRCI